MFHDAYGRQEQTLRQRLQSCGLDDVKATCTELEALKRTTDGALLDVIAEIDRREGWRSDGAKSMVEWISFRLDKSHATAAEMLRVARALEDLPTLHEAYSSGHLDWDQLRRLTRVATSDNEAALLQETKALNLVQLDALVQRLRRVARSEAAERDRDRYLFIKTDPELGHVRFRGTLPDVEGALFKNAIDKIADAAPRDPETGFYPRYEQSRADALVTLADRFLSTEQFGDASRPTLVVHADAELLAGRDGVAQMENGTALAAETAQRLGCDAEVELSFDGRDGKPVGIGKKSRRPPGWLVRQVRKRDIGCRFGGCGSMGPLHTHHIVFWIPDGRTEKPNLISLCRRHHSLVHEGGWKVRGDADGVVEFVRPDGRVLRSGVPDVSPELRRRLLGPLLPGET